MAALLEFLQEYVEQLGELTSPVKAKINSLTMLAAEEAAANPAAAPSIAAAIEKRINTAPANGKLPALFLLDSIAKNAKEPFIQIFSRNLPEVFLVAWETCLADRSTLQRVLLTWDRVFPPQPLEAIRRRAGLAPSLASAPAAAAAGATAAAAAAAQPAPQPAAASAALSALQAALLGATAAPVRPPPMQREPASLRPVGHEQPAAAQPQQRQPHAPAAGAMQQPSVPATLPQQGPAAVATGGGVHARLGPDQIAALREAASARLAAARAPKPQPHRRQPQPQAQRRGPDPPVPAPAAVGRGREYEPTMPGAAAGGNALRPEQMSQLESLLKSLAQGTSSLPVGTAVVPPAAPTSSRLPSADELWSPATLKERNPAAVGALLASSEALLPAQLDRAFAAKRRARARGTAMASRTWFPSPSAWLAGAAPDADPSAAFGQEADAAVEAPVMQSVAADDTQTQCALSGEKFETFWDDELQQWRYKDARRLDAAEASRYGVQEGAIVLVSALSVDQPEATAAALPAPTAAAEEDSAAGAALAAAVQHEAAASETGGAGAGPAALAALPPDLPTCAAAPAAVAVGNGHATGADVKLEPEARDRLPAHTSAAGSTETGSTAALPLAASATEAAPADLQTALQPSSGAANAPAGNAQQRSIGSKRPLDDNGLVAAADGPPIAKVKREAV